MVTLLTDDLPRSRCQFVGGRRCSRKRRKRIRLDAGSLKARCRRCAGGQEVKLAEGCRDGQVLKEIKKKVGIGKQK